MLAYYELHASGDKVMLYVLVYHGVFGLIDTLNGCRGAVLLLWDVPFSHHCLKWLPTYVNVLWRKLGEGEGSFYVECER